MRGKFQFRLMTCLFASTLAAILIYANIRIRVVQVLPEGLHGKETQGKLYIVVRGLFFSETLAAATGKALEEREEIILNEANESPLIHRGNWVIVLKNIVVSLLVVAALGIIFEIVIRRFEAKRPAPPVDLHHNTKETPPAK